MGQQGSRHVVSAVRGRGRVRPPRARTLVGGVLLGGALVVGLLLAGVVGVPGVVVAEPPLGRWSTVGPDPLIARQPELTGALLGAADMPAGYVTAPASGPSPTPTPNPTRPSPRAVERGEVELDPDCRQLLERPWDVAADAARPVDRAVVELSQRRRGDVLRQTLTVFGHQDARRAFARLDRLAEGCRQFDAALDDGTAVRVRARELRVGRIGDETSAVLFTARAGQQRYAGYLAMARLGPLLIVLRHVGPAGSVGEPEEVAETLRRSIAKAGPFARERDD
ncbi:hypothetical protein SAMN05444365_10550 [Micromonospora pattaloongensis]|uniref:PknH-like extracellular domain-containing protein n=1 Tax=Micromonospora pattaloongensis TaxID=405436 RepID=A0A1H3PVM2_9ACTN|nr:hypothetical protein [Micromonospora pattaloongensis]SDZ05013.1 hypothetical protein SAMN05444365_10550 [Micromonospora pattaloongensis]